jgi:hypothetical protein
VLLTSAWQKQDREGAVIYSREPEKFYSIGGDSSEGIIKIYITGFSDLFQYKPLQVRNLMFLP